MTDLVRKAAALVLLPNLCVQNANAISSPLSWGFPSPTAFTGFAHALQRKAMERGLSACFQEGFGGVGIICHDFQPQVSWSSGDRAHVFHLTRNPGEKEAAHRHGGGRPRTHGGQPGYRGKGSALPSRRRGAIRRRTSPYRAGHAPGRGQSVAAAGRQKDADAEMVATGGRPAGSG